MFDPRTAIPVICGVLNVAAIAVAAFVLRSISLGGRPVVTGAFISVSLLLTALLGAGPVYLLGEYRVILPTLLSGSFTYTAVVNRGAIHSFVEVFLIPPFTLVLAVIVGLVTVAELVARERVGLLSTAPLW